jgi:polysaccharide chain length determinant protein (PEP-CTERM system associated)
MNVEAGLQVADIWGIVHRRGKVIAMTSLVLMLSAYWIAMALPNEYSSYATVLVEPQTVDPDLVSSAVAASDLNTRLALMSARILSRSRLSGIIDKLDLYPEESTYMQRQEIIDLMRGMVNVAPVASALAQGTQSKTPETINQFKISFSDRDPRVAMQVTRTLSNDFIEQHIEDRISISQKSLEFIEEELSRLAKRIRDVEARVAEVKADNTGRLPEDMVASQHRLERLTTDLAFVQRTHAESTSDEAFFRSQVNNAEAVSRHEEVSPARRLTGLDVVLTDYKARGYTDKHPDVVKAQQEVLEIRAFMARQQAASEDDSEAGSEPTLSFSQQSAEAERRRAELRRQAAEEEIGRVQAAMDDVQLMLAETPAVAELLSGLEREYKHLFGSYQDFSNRQLEATVQAQLERRQLGEHFRVLEAAFIAPNPSSPDRLMIIALGVVFAVAVGAGLGILLESVDGSFHSARQLQSAIGIPVLAAIPRISLEADLAALRRSRIRSAIGATVITAFALTGGFINYMWVNGAPGFLSAAITDGEVEPVRDAEPARPRAGS